MRLTKQLNVVVQYEEFQESVEGDMCITGTRSSDGFLHLTAKLHQSGCWRHTNYSSNWCLQFLKSIGIPVAPSPSNRSSTFNPAWIRTTVAQLQEA